MFASHGSNTQLFLLGLFSKWHLALIISCAFVHSNLVGQIDPVITSSLQTQEAAREAWPLGAEPDPWPARKLRAWDTFGSRSTKQKTGRISIGEIEIVLLN